MSFPAGILPGVESLLVGNKDIILEALQVAYPIVAVHGGCKEFTGFYLPFLLDLFGLKTMLPLCSKGDDIYSGPYQLTVNFLGENLAPSFQHLYSGFHKVLRLSKLFLGLSSNDFVVLLGGVYGLKAGFNVEGTSILPSLSVDDLPLKILDGFQLVVKALGDLDRLVACPLMTLDR